MDIGYDDIILGRVILDRGRLDRAYSWLLGEVGDVGAGRVAFPVSFRLDAIKAAYVRWCMDFDPAILDVWVMSGIGNGGNGGELRLIRLKSWADRDLDHRLIGGWNAFEGRWGNGRGGFDSNPSFNATATYYKRTRARDALVAMESGIAVKGVKRRGVRGVVLDGIGQLSF